MLLERTSPRQVLEDCVRALESRQDQLAELKSTLTDMCCNLEGLQLTIEHALSMSGRRSLVVTNSTCESVIVDALGRWQADTAEDCPLPDLYRQTELVEPGLTIGEFHDALRRLQSAQRLRLQPWTGPLYGMPEPSFALLIGHEIAYYASGFNMSARPDYSTEEAWAAPGRA